MTQLDTCKNCNRQIGALEQAYLWGDAIVCPQCYGHLSNAQSPTPAPIPPPLPSVRERKYVDHLRGVKIAILAIAAFSAFAGLGLMLLLRAGSDALSTSDVNMVADFMNLAVWLVGGYLIFWFAGVIMKANWKSNNP